MPNRLRQLERDTRSPRSPAGASSTRPARRTRNGRSQPAPGAPKRLMGEAPYVRARQSGSKAAQAYARTGYTARMTPDAGLAVPPFSASVRGRMLRPLLSATEREKAAAWIDSKYPGQAGMDPGELADALQPYVDAAAVAAAVGTPANTLGVLAETVHQFQRKIFTAADQHDGLPGSGVLDSLGYIPRTGLPTTYSPSAGGSARVQSHDAAVQRATGGRIAAATWFDHVARPGIFGIRVMGGRGVHSTLLRRMRTAERALMGRAAYAGQTPVQIGAANGVFEIRGGRPGDDTGMHSIACAVDMSYARNPWVGRARTAAGSEFTAVLDRAMQLVEGRPMGHASASALWNAYGQAATYTSARAWDAFAARNDTFIQYLSLRSNRAALEAALRARQGQAGQTGVNAGESIADAADRWGRVIASDYTDLTTRPSGFQIGSSSSFRDPDRGFLSFGKDLVVALRDTGCLAWGAIDFGPRASGDVMHFDNRTDPLFQTLFAATSMHIPGTAHPCHGS